MLTYILDGLYFSSFQTSQTIKIDSSVAPFTALLNSLKSYIIEIWFYPDYIFPTNQIYVANSPNYKNYIFYTNSMRVYWNHSVNRFYIEYGDYLNATPPSAVIVPTTTDIVKYEWNKLIFNVKYDAATVTYFFEFFSKNRIQTATKLSVGSLALLNDFKFLIFTHFDQNAGPTLNQISWGSGYYRNLRFWNGDETQPWVISQYDDL